MAPWPATSPWPETAERLQLRLASGPCLRFFEARPACLAPLRQARSSRPIPDPHWLFFDFDPKGLSIAASLPRRERLCLPDWPRLEAQTRRMKRAHLDGQTDPDIAEAWRRMRALSARPGRRRLGCGSCTSTRGLRSTLPPHARSPSRSCASLASLWPAWPGTCTPRSAPKLGAQSG